MNHDRDYNGNPMNQMQRDIADLRETRGRLEATVKHLSGTVDNLSEAVQALNSTIDKSRGALWVIASASGGVAALLSSWLTSWIHKP